MSKKVCKGKYKKKECNFFVLGLCYSCTGVFCVDTDVDVVCPFCGGKAFLYSFKSALRRDRCFSHIRDRGLVYEFDDL